MAKYVSSKKLQITTTPDNAIDSNMKYKASHHLLHLFINSTSQHLLVTALSLYQCKLVCLVFQLVDVVRIYSLIAQSLKFAWQIQIT